MNDQTNRIQKNDEKRRLDRIDGQILDALANNARMSNKQLAGKVNLAPSTCLERTRRLIRDGVIRGFHADVDPKALGLPLEAMIAVKLKQHTRELFTSFRAHVLSIPEVVAAYHMAGANDFLVHVRVADADALRDLAIDQFTTRDEVQSLETALMFEQLRRHGLSAQPDDLWSVAD